MKIGILLASVRVDPLRLSHRVAYYTSNKLQAEGSEVDFLDLRDVTLPFFTGETSQHSLAEVERVMHFFKNCDGYVFVFPEYNHSLPPTLMNALNFLENRELMHKPLALISNSSGIGGQRSTFVGRGSIPTLGAVIVPTVVNVVNVKTTFTENLECTDKKTEGYLENQRKELTVYATALRLAREELGGGGSILANIQSCESYLANSED